MTRELTHIEQDIEDLEQEVIAIAQELHETYSEYFAVLSETVQRQIILTTYHLCTQGYPKRFLKRSLKQRQQLQHDVQVLAKTISQDLLNPTKLSQLTQPFTEELDGERGETSEDREQDMMLRNLSAFVKRVLSDESKSGDDDSSSSGRSILSQLSDDSDDNDAGDRPSARLEAIIIPENFSLDFLSDAQLEDSDEDSVDFDSDDPEDDADTDNYTEDDIAFQGFSVQPTMTEDNDSNDDLASPADYTSESEIDKPSSLDQADESMTDSHQHQPSHSSASLSEAHSDAHSSNEEQPSSSAATEAALSLVSSTIEKANPQSIPIRPTPKALMRRCKRLEKQIRLIVKNATEKTNHLLQESEILPKKLPSAVLEAAFKAELSSSDTERSPNVLNLLVETGGNQEKPKMMQVKAVRLRIEEIEFNNPTLTAWRSRIRELWAQLQSFDKTYRGLQHEKHVADAEAAWRSTWYENAD